MTHNSLIREPRRLSSLVHLHIYRQLGAAGRSCDFSDDFGGYATHNRMWWDIFCDHGARRNNRALTYVHTIEDNRSGTDPCIVVYPDPLGRNPLFDNRTRWILVNVIYRHDLDERRC